MTWDLGLKHIWIDSLCIVQDNPADWEIQSTTMANVYSNSHLTIAVGSSLEGIESFLALLTNNLTEMSKAKSPWLISQNTIDSLRKYVLNSRGWCFQERQLSKRIIDVLLTDVVWEGAGAVGGRLKTLKHPTIERWPHYSGEDEQFVDYVLGRTQDLKTDGYPWESRFVGPEDDLIHGWYRLITEYTRRQLTFQKDRLVAFSAIASKFEKYTGRPCTLGALDGYLVACMLWRTPKKDHAANPVLVEKNLFLHGVKCQIPSWSWAALCGEVEFHSFDERQHVSDQIEVAAMSLQTMSGYTEDDTPAIGLYGFPIKTTICKDYQGGFSVAMNLKGFLRKILGNFESSGDRFKYYPDQGIHPEFQEGFFVPLYVGDYSYSLDYEDIRWDHITCCGLFLQTSVQSFSAWERTRFLTWSISNRVPKYSKYFAIHNSTLERRQVEGAFEVSLL